MQKLKQKLFAGLTAVLLTGSLTAFAETDFEPHEQTFIISAYYSPLPDQRVYFRGSYDADRRLNGNGTNGADGTQVYPGMLAAPKSYAFGTKLAIPGLGVGTIHDRGGAIVDAGVRGQPHDRIDVWMGRGEVGLARALQWGMRTVTATVYPAGFAIAESFDLPEFSTVFVADLQIGGSGEEVRQLQIELKTYGYFREAISGEFNETTQTAVLGYQLARQIVASADDVGAGVLGPQTRESLNAEIFRRTWKPPTRLLVKNNLTPLIVAQSSAAIKTTSAQFPVTLSPGDRGDRVRDLQIALTKTGHYECEINGIYNERMEECVFDFQQDLGVLSARDEFGAGHFGAKTRTALTNALTKRATQLNSLIASKIPDQTMSPDDTGAAVAKLQAGLQKLGYFADKIGDEYSTSTAAAVAKFQVAAGILESKTSYGAGFFGPKTKIAFEQKLRERLLAGPSLPENPAWDRPVYVAYTPQFNTQLALGDSGEKVRELQAMLQKLDFLAAEPTGNFGEQTQAAIIKFQIENIIVGSATEFGAGSFGPKTRAALNAKIKSAQIALQKKVVAEA